jgi:hypothetical protein
MRMSPEEIASHTLELLRQLGAEQGAMTKAFDDFRAEMRERVGGLELSIAGIRRDMAHMSESLAALSVRVDGLARRLDRIERRLDLIDPALPPQ